MEYMYFVVWCNEILYISRMLDDDWDKKFEVQRFGGGKEVAIKMQCIECLMFASVKLDFLASLDEVCFVPARQEMEELLVLPNEIIYVLSVRQGVVLSSKEIEEFYGIDVNSYPLLASETD